MSPVKGYSPQSDPIFVVVRRLPKAFLNLGDPTSIFVTKHLTITKIVDPYLPRPMKDELQPKKGKKKAVEAPPSKQPKSKKQKKTSTFSTWELDDSESEKEAKKQNEPIQET
ncbi:hypothetical protein L1887_39011 [Cichorium endivia]|nr:hypothetical protein L1887_39011 [Cichorium endivia]